MRAADPRSEGDRILPVLARNLSNAASAERFRWLYLDNPHGVARLWVAETARGEIVGTSAGHPKRAWLDGRVHEVLDMSDFALDADHRTAGPGLQLIRATLGDIEGSRFTLSYDHPSRAMLALLRRIGGREVSPRRRWVRLLEVSDLLARRWGAIARTAGRLGDALLRTRDAIASRHARSISLLTGACGPEFDRLDERTCTRTRFRMQRSSAALRWRFQRNPMARHEILCARAGGELCGYLVFRPEPGRTLAIVDLLTMDDAVWGPPLIDALITLGHERRQAAVSATVLCGSPVESVFARDRFVARQENAGLVITAPRISPELASGLHCPDQWWMLEGDEDV